MKDPEFQDFIERVRRESDIVALLSEYVSLKKKGKYYWGCCPFHDEKTASFSVTPEKGFFYCYGCHAGGDVFGFLMKHDGLSFWEAAKKLAEKFQIPLPQKEKTEQELTREREQARMLAVNETAGKFFNACLVKTKYGVAARAYLKNRGIQEEWIEKFQLGFAPDAWDKLALAFVRRGFSKELLLKAGLALERKSGGIYDRFRNRIMFPIADERGRLIGFGGRVLDDSQPKYLNSPETIVFNKRDTLFALHLAARAIKAADCAVIVEGYMDAITAHSYGLTNVVASLGTAFTPQQCSRLLRYTRRLVFSYDSDAAGQNATLRALAIASRMGADVRVLTIPDGKDPDEFLHRHGKAAFEKLVLSALPLVEYQIHQAMARYDNTTLEGKVGAVAALVPVLAALDNAVRLNTYIQEISQKLGIDEGAVRSELGKWQRRGGQDNFVKKGQNRYIKPIDNAVVQAARHLIRAMWSERSLIPFMSLEMPPDKFADSRQREIIEYLYAKNKEPHGHGAAAAALSQSAGAELARCLVEDGGAADAVLEGCMRTINLAYLKRLYEKHRLRADELERMGDEGYLRELAESQKIQYEINKLQCTGK